MVYAVVDGQFVDQDHLYIAEIVNDYDPNLHLVYIPEDKREPGDKPFAVIHTQRDGQQYVALYADKCDQRILERLFMADNAKGDVMKRTEAKNAAAEAVRLKRDFEEREEKKELAASILKSPLNTYRHNGVVYQ